MLQRGYINICKPTTSYPTQYFLNLNANWLLLPTHNITPHFQHPCYNLTSTAITLYPTGSINTFFKSFWWEFRSEGVGGLFFSSFG